MSVCLTWVKSGGCQPNIISEDKDIKCSRTGDPGPGWMGRTQKQPPSTRVGIQSPISAAYVLCTNTADDCIQITYCVLSNQRMHLWGEGTSRFDTAFSRLAEHTRRRFFSLSLALSHCWLLTFRLASGYNRHLPMLRRELSSSARCSRRGELLWRLGFPPRRRSCLNQVTLVLVFLPPAAHEVIRCTKYIPLGTS